MKKLFLITCILFLAMATTASTLVSLGNELIRINPENNRIEASTNQGRSWMTRYSGSYYGTFKCLLVHDNELIAATSKGVAVSTNGGRSWMTRYSGSFYGEFQSLTSGNGEILATTTKGLYASRDGGRSWIKRS